MTRNGREEMTRAQAVAIGRIVVGGIRLAKQLWANPSSEDVNHVARFLINAERTIRETED